MEITYKNKFLDVLLFQTRQVYTKGLNLLIIFGAAGYLSWSEYNWCVQHGRTLSFAYILLYFVIASATFFMAYILITFLFVLVYMTKTKDRGVLTTHRITISPAALIEETPYNRTDAFWHGIYEVVKTSRYIYVYISPMQAHIIPRRAFENTEHFAGFHECLVEAHREGNVQESQKNSL